ncbi:MAG: PEP/pyruvate-binding domain-containing protein [Dehalococcoidia bacterium]
MTFIHVLGDGPAGAALLGGKGNALDALVRAGKQVPSGFVLTTMATAAMAEGQPWPPEMASAFASALDGLIGDGSTVAVRSSATGEDASDASFAGQHQTVLSVPTLEAAREAVATCLASLHAESATAYRYLATADDQAAMAVVVQRMVDAVAAGVAFTDDPTGRHPGHIVVEAVAGPGELLVSGLAQAENIVLTREGHLVERESPGEPVLTDRQAVEVAAAARACAELFGSEQDIEYAFDRDGVLWLLQSRPITTTAPAADSAATGWASEFDTPTGPNELWTSANIQEVLPGLLTPLSMSTGTRSSQAAFVRGYQRLGLIARDESPPWIAFFYNRAFLNVGTTRMLGARALGASGDGVEIQFLGGEATADLPSEPLRKRARFMAGSLVPLGRLLFGARTRTERFEREVRQAERKRLTLATGDCSDAALRSLLLSGEEISGRAFAHHLHISGLASAAYTNLERLLRTRLGDERSESAIPTLLTGLKNVESARIGIDIWNLSRVALNTGIGPALRDDSVDPRSEALPPEWRAAFRSFLRAHGHRGMREMEASTLTWRSDPSPVIAAVRGYLDLPVEQSPLATLERQETARLALTEDLRRDIGWLVRPLYNRFLRDAQDFVALRERTKSIIVRSARMSDPLIEECARRCVERGIISDVEDVFFLSYEELLDIPAGTDVANSHQTTVARRRKEMERNRYIDLPKRFRGHPTPLPPASSSDGTVLTGMAVSAGSVTARARVIRDPAIDDGIQPGEILVAPVTDAGWTPLFGLSVGLVVDIGSALSHGSTIAREYGLPAVVNVHHGTRTIRTGDLVHIDGAAGTVTIMERRAPPN